MRVGPMQIAVRREVKSCDTAKALKKDLESPTAFGASRRTEHDALFAAVDATGAMKPCLKTTNSVSTNGILQYYALV
jgi:hypothetical protein